MVMRSSVLMAFLTGTGLIAGGLAYAQMDSSTMTRPNSGNIVKQPDVTPDQRQLRDDAFNRKLDRNRSPSKAQVASDVAGAFAKLKLPCTVSDARLVAKGRTEGSSQETTTYEATCDSGLGYFVVSGDQADAFSCFAADAAAQKDIEQKRTPSATCTLPANRDVKIMAETVLGNAGFKCSVSNLRWIGISAKAGTEFTEAKCVDGSGYVLMTAVPGSSAAPSAVPCTDANKRGLQCTLSKIAAPQVNLGMLTDALAARKIACTTDQNGIRVVGQETMKKRYVVEFKCQEHPAGLVAFVPLASSSAEFESMDCAEAKKHNVMCSLK